ncbi:hypothetical protein, conserved, partial [Eimeria acervulina]
GSTASALKAIDVSIAQGASVLLNAFSSSSSSKALLRALSFAAKANGGRGTLIINAAGNDAEDLSIHPRYPASFDIPNVINVAAAAPSGSLADFSNYGLPVHLAAPGDKIFSTDSPDGYTYRSTTSAAAAFVSGAAALVYSWFAAEGSSTTAAEVKEILRVSAAAAETLKDKVEWGAQVDAEAAIQVAQLGGMWVQIDCKDKHFSLPPGGTRVVTVYVQPFLSGEFKRNAAEDQINKTYEEALKSGVDEDEDDEDNEDEERRERERESEAPVDSSEDESYE